MMVRIILLMLVLSIIYIYNTNISPIMIRNRMCENQNLLHIVPLMRHTIVVCSSNISPMGD